jgi:ornithine--oxo-acid transaminase
LAARVGREALRVLVDEGLPERARVSGAAFRQRISAAHHPLIVEVRGRGLMLGVQLADHIKVHKVVKQLYRAGVVTKDTHHNSVRLSPPLNTALSDLEWGADRLLEVLDQFA